MEQAQRKPDLAFIEKMQEFTSKLDRRGAAESGIHLIVAQMCKKDAELEAGQKADLLSACLELHAAVVLSEFCRVLTTSEDGRPYDLIRQGGDQETKKSVIQAGVAHTVVKTEDMVEKKAKRLFTLSDMLFSPEDMAQAKVDVDEFKRRKKTAAN